MAESILNRIERRVRKDIRLNNPFSKGEKVLVVDDGTKEAVLTLYLFRRITRGLNLDVEIRKSAEDAENYAKIVAPADADDKISMFIEKFFKKRKSCENMQTNKPRKIIAFLKTVLDSEVSEAVRIISPKTGGNKQENEKKHLLDGLEEMYPGSKFAFLKSIASLQGLK